MGLGSDIGSTFGDLGVNVDIFGGGIGNFISNLVIFVLFLGVLGVIVYFAYQKKLYTEKIQIFEEVNGQSVPTRQYRAREVTIPNTSIKVFQIKENGMYLPRPTIQTGKNNWIFFIRDDHEWVNIGISSLNKQLTELGVNYNHVDMRYANASLKELIKSNYGSGDFWKQYGHYILMGAGFLLLALGFYLGAEQLAEASVSLTEAQGQFTTLLQEIKGNVTTSGITKLN